MKLDRKIGLAGVFCIASGAMISSGLFVLPAIAYSKAGPAVVVSYILAGIFVLPALFSMAELLTAMPKAGGFWISRGMGSLAGFLGGLSSWLSLACKSAFALVGIGVFATLIFPGISEFIMDLVAGFFCVFFMLINLAGTKTAEKFQVALVFALLVILGIYIVSGSTCITISHYSGFFVKGARAILGTAGLVFISFAGLTKVTSLAEEIKDPAKNIPLGMLLSWGVVVAVYALAVFITVGILPGDRLASSLTPLSDAASYGMGRAEAVILAAGAMLAFISTANAGILTASRTPMSMSRDGFLPPSFGRLNRRGVPYIPVIFTSLIILAGIFFLDIVRLVEVASTIIIILFILANASLIFMRESGVINYKPVFRTPLYPYMQASGIIVYLLFLFEMGSFALSATGMFLAVGILWYLLYPYKLEAKKSALVHVVERIIGRQIKTDTLGRELKEVLRERDNIVEDRFDSIIKVCKIMDIGETLELGVFLREISASFSEKTGISADELYGEFRERERMSPTVIKSGLAIPHIIVEKEGVFEIIPVRAKKGIIFEWGQPPVKTAFVIVASAKERNFYLRALMAIAEIIREEDFEQNWLSAKSMQELRDIILLAARRREDSIK